MNNPLSEKTIYIPFTQEMADTLEYSLDEIESIYDGAGKTLYVNTSHWAYGEIS